MCKDVLRTLVFFLLVTFGLGCSKGNISNNNNDDGDTGGRALSEGIVLKDGVFYFSGDDQQYISVQDTNKITVKANIPSQMKFGIGNVVLVDFSKETPMGFAGKVISQKEESGETVFYTQSVSLEEIFEELSIDSVIDVYKDADSVVDDEGQVYELKPIEDGDIEQLSEEGNQPVKGLADKEFSSFKSIPIESTYFSGRLFVSSFAHVKINISKGKVNEYDILLERQSYLASQLGVKADGGITIPVLPEVNFALPAGIPLCPGIVLQPILSASVNFNAEGEIRLQSPVFVKFEDTSVRFHNGEYTNNSKTQPKIELTPTYLDCEVSAELTPRVALRFDVWGLKLLGFGVDVLSSFKLSLNGSMKMSNREQLKKDVKANVEIESSLGLFLYAKFLKGNDLRAAISFPSLSYELDLLDKGKNHSIKKETGEWSVTGEFGDDVLLHVDKCGYALFRIGEEEPLEKTFFETAKTKSGNDVAVFNIPDNSFDYYVRTINTIDDYQFYGPIVSKFISSLDMKTWNGVMSFSFQYDKYGRCVKVNRKDDGQDYYVINYSYDGDRIIATWNDGSEIINTDSQGRLLSYSGTDSYSYGSMRNRTVSYPNSASVVINMINISTDDTYTTKIDLIYADGDLKKEIWQRSDEVSYSYTSYPDDYSIDFTHYLLDEMGASLVLPPFLAFPGLRNQHLLKTPVPAWMGDSELPISYSFDDEGRVTHASWHEESGSSFFEMSISYEEQPL